MMRQLALGCMATVGLLICGSAALAASVSWSTMAPATDADDVFNFTSSTADINNVNDGGDLGTYMARDRLGVGQSFTTGSNPLGYFLDSFSYQHVAYESDTSFWSIDSGWGTGAQFEVKFGNIVAGNLVQIGPTQTVFVGDSDYGDTTQLNVAGNQSGTGAGEWWTFTFDNPIPLLPNTEYAFSVFLDGGAYIETAGVDTNPYGGGSAFDEQAGTVPNVYAEDDHAFHANLRAIPEPSSVALCGLLGMIGLAGGLRHRWG